MTVKKALASWKGKAVKAAMEEEIRSLIGMGTWELVERPRGVNIMKNRWVLKTKYRLDDTVEHEKARLVVKGFTQVCGADYDETYSPPLRAKAFAAAVYRALDGVLLGAGWKKSQVDEALYFKASDNGVTCWVLVYVDNLRAACSSPAMLKDLKQLLEDAFELREISPVVKFLGLEIVRDWPARKLWLHQEGYADKLRRRFIDEEQGGRVPKTPVSVDAYAELTFDEEEAKLGSGLTLRSDQHWSEVNRCLAYLADTCDTALEFGGGPESLELIGYVEADDVGDKQKRTSMSGYVFRVRGSRAIVRDTSADKLSSPAIPCGPAPSGVSQVDPLPGTLPVEVVVDSGAAGGAASEGVASGGAEPGGAEPGGTELDGAEPGGTESKGAESGGAESRGGASAGGPAGASPRPSPWRESLSPQQLREWFAQRTHLRSGAAGAGGSAVGGTGAGGTGATSFGGAGDTARARGTRDPGVGDPGAGGTGTRGAGAGGARAGGTGTGAGGAGAGDTGAGGAGPGGTSAGGVRSGCTSAEGAGAGGTGAGGAGARGTRAGDTGAGGAGASGPGAGGTLAVYTASSITATERREPESRPASPVHAIRTRRCVPHRRPPPVPGTHVMAVRPSSVPLRNPLPSPPASSLPNVPDPESNLARAASPTAPRLLATVFTYPSFDSTPTSALLAELVDFAAACRLEYATSLVAESESECLPSVRGECALGTDVLEERQEDFECLAAAVPHLMAMLLAREGDPDAPDIPTPRSYAEAITGLYSSQWQIAMNVEMASWKSTSTYVDAVPPSGANIVDGMWIFRVKQPPGSPPFFKSRYVARGFGQRQGVDFFHTFSPTPKMTTLRVLLHVAAQRDYDLHSLDFSTAFLQGSLHEEIWLRCPPGFTWSFPACT
ncbi:unnamed protein product [Closterium sp. NIES-54]